MVRLTKQVHDRLLGRPEDFPLEVRIDPTQHVLENFPGLPSVQPCRHLSSTDREGGESSDLEAFAFLAISLERLPCASVLEGLSECLHIETHFPRDLGLDLDSVNGAGIEAPRFSESSQVPSIG